MYCNNIVNFQESTTILNACTKKVWKLIEAPYMIECMDKISDGMKCFSFPTLKNFMFSISNYIAMTI